MIVIQRLLYLSYNYKYSINLNVLTSKDSLLNESTDIFSFIDFISSPILHIFF